MKTWQFRAGALESCEGVPLTDRAFRYGWSVFETLQVTSGRLLFLAEHLQRFRRALGELSFGQVPDGLDAALLAHEWKSDGLLRWYATAGPGGLLDAARGAIYVLFEEEDAFDGAPARVLSYGVPFVPAGGGWKTGNYLFHIHARQAAAQSACDEALIFDPAGVLVSASMANVFLQRNGTWKTPALGGGARDGVIREWFVRRTGAEETLLTAADVLACEAMLLTNSRMGLRPVAECDGRPLDVCEDWPRIYREEIL